MARRIFVVTIVLLSFCCAGALAQISDAGRIISGVVVNANDEPVFAARVSLTVQTLWPTTPLPSPSPTQVADTDDVGRFTLRNVEPGIYAVTVENRDGRLGAMQVLLVRPDLQASELKILVRAVGSISGRAIDSSDLPITGGRVELLPVAGNVRSRSLEQRTDAEGKFHFAGVDPGRYFVRLSRQDQPNGKDYPTTYYPNVTDSSLAQIITVAQGQEATGIDIHLFPTGVTIRGRIIDVSKSPVTHRLVLILRNPAGVPVSPYTFVRTDEQRFEIWGVAPGSYYLYCVTGQDPTKGYREIVNEQDLQLALRGVEWTRVPLEVGSEGIADLSINMKPAGSVRGHVMVDANATEIDVLDRSSIKVGLSFAEEVPTLKAELYADVTSEGTFELLHISEAALSFRDVILPDGWFVSRILQDGTDVTETTFSVPSGTEVNITVMISNAGGTLSGLIQDSERNPVPAARYVLLPAPSHRSSRLFIHSGAAYEKGAFKLSAIPPGEYTLIAFPDNEKYSTDFLKQLENLESYEHFGQLVHIDAGQTSEVTAVVIPDFF